MDNGKEWPVDSLEEALDVLDRRRAMILLRLMDGTKRFGTLKNELDGIAQKTLAVNLRALEKAGLLTRKVYAEVPPKVEYTLTEAGYNLRPVLEALSGWSARYFGSAQHRGKE